MTPLLQHLITEDGHALDFEGSNRTADVRPKFLNGEDPFSFKCAQNLLSHRNFSENFVSTRENSVPLSRLIKERNSFAVVQKLLPNYSTDVEDPHQPIKYSNKTYRDSTAQVNDWIGRELKSLGISIDCRSYAVSHRNFKEAILPCHLCNKMFVYQTFLDKHIAAKHANETTATNKPDSTEQNIKALPSSEPKYSIVDLIKKKRVRSLADIELDNESIYPNHKQTIRISPDKTKKLEYIVKALEPKQKMRSLPDKSNYEVIGVDLNKKMKILPHKSARKVIGLCHKQNTKTLPYGKSEYEATRGQANKQVTGASPNNCFGFKMTGIKVGLVPKRKVPPMHRKKLDHANAPIMEYITLD